VERLFLLIGTHFLGDFPFQSEWMVKHKGRNFSFVDSATGVEICVARWYEVMFYHVATYVATMYVFMRLAGYSPAPQGVIIDGVMHYLVDALKCRGVIKAIWLDQLCHLMVRTALWWVGWL